MSNKRTHLTDFRMTRRNLPHWQEPGSDYFITWTTANSVKSFSAHEINKLRQQRGVVWLDEREDRMIRNGHEFWQK